MKKSVKTVEIGASTYQKAFHAVVNATSHEFRQKLLVESAAEGETDVVLLLLREVADINCSARIDYVCKDPVNDRPLSAAIRYGHTNTALTLIGRGAKVDTHSPDGISMINLAIEAGDMKVLNALIDNGADVNLANVKYPQLTPLHTACKSDQMQALRILLTHSHINLLVADSNDLKPIDYAKEQSREKIMKMMKAAFIAGGQEASVAPDTLQPA